MIKPQSQSTCWYLIWHQGKFFILCCVAQVNLDNKTWRLWISCPFAPLAVQSKGVQNGHEETEFVEGWIAESSTEELRGNKGFCVSCAWDARRMVLKEWVTAKSFPLMLLIQHDLFRMPGTAANLCSSMEWLIYSWCSSLICWCFVGINERFPHFTLSYRDQTGNWGTVRLRSKSSGNS